jgi:hypothetical protein
MLNKVKQLFFGILVFAALFSFTAFNTTNAAHAAAISASTHAVTMTTSRTASPLATTTTCYGGEVLYGPFSLNANTLYFWPGSGSVQTSGRCQDININFTQLTASMQMRVCFDNISQPYCNSWKTVSHTGTWYLIATSVLAGTSFHFQIQTTSAVTFKAYVAI